MVKVCEQIYSEQDNEKYSEHFNKFPYELSIFQKYAIQGIIEDKSVLVISHTGSGKTNSCLFAIDYFTSLDLNDTEYEIAKVILKEIESRLHFMNNVGIDYSYRKYEC